MSYFLKNIYTVFSFGVSSLKFGLTTRIPNTRPILIGAAGELGVRILSLTGDSSTANFVRNDCAGLLYLTEIVDDVIDEKLSTKVERRAYLDSIIDVLSGRGESEIDQCHKLARYVYKTTTNKAPGYYGDLFHEISRVVLDQLDIHDPQKLLESGIAAGKKKIALS